MRNPHADLHQPDLIILPGTKSTIADLMWLRESGLEALIKQKSSEGIPVFGICGGFQMLGRTISDPLQTEASGTYKCEGMGLLPIDTVFWEEKIQKQSSGTITGLTGSFEPLNGSDFFGYEIHMGQNTQLQNPVINAGNVYGSYIHGIFDSPEISNVILKALCEKKRIPFDSLAGFDLKAHKKQQYDLLAETVRNSLDINLVYSILERCN